ncbi:MAG: signal recognition particle protein, partial [Microbacterium gubbeenense]
QLVNRFEQAAKMMKKVARGENAGIPGMGAMPGQKPGASSKRGKKNKGKFQGNRSGNPAKRAAAPELPAQAPAGAGFGLGAAAPTDASEPDMEEIRKLFGNK